MAEEFPPGRVVGASREKIRQVMAERGGDDELRGAAWGSSGAKPGGEVAPDELGLSGREALEDALSDEADLDMAVIGREFSSDGDSIGLGLMMKELVAGAATDWLHVHHPKMIGPGADGVEGMFERELDLETQSVEADDLGGREREVGGHEDQATAGRMDHGDETHEAAGGTPQKITRSPLQDDVAFAVGGTGHGLEGRSEKIAQTQLATVQARTAAAAAAGGRDRFESASVVPDPGNQMAILGEESADDFAAGVVRIGDQEDRLGEVQLSQQQKEFVEEGALIAVAEDQAFVDPSA